VIGCTEIVDTPCLQPSEFSASGISELHSFFTKTDDIVYGKLFDFHFPLPPVVNDYRHHVGPFVDQTTVVFALTRNSLHRAARAYTTLAAANSRE